MNLERLIFAVVSLTLFGAFLLSFVNESMCSSGCGNITRPLFTFAHYTLGIWGVRVLLMGGFALFFVGLVRTRD